MRSIVEGAYSGEMVFTAARLLTIFAATRLGWSPFPAVAGQD